ncbi:unnamed protein product [Aphanomyces euteiches]|nr:hypothetical protein Ae201684P_018496 [Aphanomyces euteiches]KAH9146128.1 hypothetical protein AeRB84_010008 [Aphanomyces euteiches]
MHRMLLLLSLVLLEVYALVDDRLLRALSSSPRVAPEVIAGFHLNRRVDVLVFLYGSTTDLAGDAANSTHYVQQLQAFTKAKQREVHSVLDSNPSEFHPPAAFFWINDAIAIQAASIHLVASLAALPSVELIRGNMQPSLESPQAGDPNPFTP